MEEREMTQRFHGLFSDILSLMEDIEKGFFGQNAKLVKDTHEKFRELLKFRATQVEKIMGDKEKDAAEMKYVSLIVPFQTIALGMENLIDRMETKLDSNILFSEKALTEIRELFLIMVSQVKDTRDYVITKNPHLGDTIKKDREEMMKLADNYSVVHEERLIAGCCMPKASYLYIDITDSLKRIAKGLVEFAERL